MKYFLHNKKHLLSELGFKEDEFTKADNVLNKSYNWIKKLLGRFKLSMPSGKEDLIASEII